MAESAPSSPSSCVAPTTVYRSALGNLIGGGCISDTMSKAWEVLNPLLCKEVLLEAHEASRKVFFDGIVVRGRQVPKTMARIRVKLAMQGRKDLGFKTNCDLMAFRVHTKDVSKIDSIMEDIKAQSLARGDKVHIRESYVNPKTGEVVKDDIVKFMYVYHADLGYLAEYQIGHPFAALKFEHDSAVRDEITGPRWVDFDSAEVNVYKIVKAYLLDPAAHPDFDFAKVWREGFGEEPPAEFAETM